MCAGVAPQQPPMSVAPSASASRPNAAKSAGVASGNPGADAAGRSESGTSGQSVRNRRAASSTDAGPTPQLNPTASGVALFVHSATRSTVSPPNPLPSAPNAKVTTIGNRPLAAAQAASAS